jgi:multidrug resistance efflux pump
MSSVQEYDEIELDINPDPDQLDRNWVDQPRLRYRYGKELADAKLELSHAKANLDVTEAELDQAIRTDKEAYGLDKITETAVKATILLQPVFKSAQKKLMDCQHAVDVMYAAVSAIEHKKAALQELVRLRLSEYYSECEAPDEAREEMEDLKKHIIRRGRRGD